MQEHTTMMAEPGNPTASLGVLKVLGYAAPTLASTFFSFGVYVVLQGIYAKYFGLSLTAIAGALLISRIFDAVTDPIIGYSADRYFSRFGTRKPFILAGGALLIIAAWFLYAPPINVSAGYFLTWMLVFFLALTLFDIPHLAWGGSLAASSQEKNKLYGLRAMLSFAGILLFFGLPYLPVFETTEVTPETLKWAVIIGGSLMAILLLACVVIAPDSRLAPTRTVPCKGNPFENVRALAESVVANKPLLVVTAAHICTGTGFGVWTSVLFIFVDTYLGMGEQFALVFAFGLSAGIVSMPLWNIANYRFGKRRSWTAAMAMVGAGYFGCLFLSPESANFPLLASMIALVYGGLAQFNIAVPALISDAADYGEWKFKADRSATYFALYTFINKTVAALGGALGLAIVGWFGFDPASADHSDAAAFGLYLTIAWIPAAFFLLSLAFILRIPLTERRHAIIRKRLDLRAARASELSENVACKTRPSDGQSKSANVVPIEAQL